MNRALRRAERQHGVDRILDDTAKRTFPASMARADNAIARVGEEYRAAIGSEYAQRDTGLVGDDAIGGGGVLMRRAPFQPPPKGGGLCSCCIDHFAAMDLLQRDELLRAKMIGDALAVGDNGNGIITRS